MRYARYDLFMIRTLKDKEAERIWNGLRSRRLPPGVQQTARRKSRMLNNAQTLDDLRIPPANRLEALRGDRRGQYSIRINDQWRICFVWRQGDAYDVEIVDYH
ncbi:MAG: type II toxin-antitoxin system RelE/ParE family toxin [Gammaproteobacteria bacterium]